MNQPLSLVCLKCGKEKPFADFLKSKSAKFGRKPWCKSCFRDYTGSWNCGGNREKAILRDGEKCVNCGMTREEHKEKFNRDITVDHIDGNGRYTPKAKKNNALSNLQTLCLPCHGRKDTTNTKLTVKDVLRIKKMFGKESGYTIAKKFKVSWQAIYHIKSGYTWKWLK